MASRLLTAAFATGRRSLPAPVPVSRAAARCYASEAPGPGKLLLSFTIPSQTILNKAVVQQVNLSSTDGDMGILADHVPTIAQLNPGLLEVMMDGSKTKKWFVSGGFAVINPDSSLNINAVEAVPLEDIDFEAAKRAAEDATRRANSGTSDKDKALAKVQLEVYEALASASSAK